MQKALFDKEWAEFERDELKRKADNLASDIAWHFHSEIKRQVRELLEPLDLNHLEKIQVTQLGSLRVQRK